MNMLHSEAHVIDRKAYDDILDYIIKRSTDLFGNLNISADIVNQTFMRLLKTDLQVEIDNEHLCAIFPKVVEDVFEDYRMKCFSYCLRKTRDPELSSDIAQETMYQLLSARTPISNVNQWIRSVAHNLLCDHYRNKYRDSDTCRQLCAEYEVMNQIYINDELPQKDDLSNFLPPDIQASDDYREMLHIWSFSSLRAYAEAEKISYEAAKSRSKKLMKNLKALLLKAMGWESGPDILDFNQYKTIQKFLRELVSISKKPAISSPDDTLSQVMSQIPRIDDWGISMMPNRRFRLLIFCFNPDQQPIFASISLELNQRNHIRIISSKLHAKTDVQRVQTEIPIKTDKGYAVLNFDDIINLVTR
ncbi:MAG: hypothetical protein KBB33_05955 [Candidatus Cloacimonetes bacterium]|nr:hypothetical protein [Candidatus Cloacimonadota bacterium]